MATLQWSGAHWPPHEPPSPGESTYLQGEVIKALTLTLRKADSLTGYLKSAKSSDVSREYLAVSLRVGESVDELKQRFQNFCDATSGDIQFFPGSDEVVILAVPTLAGELRNNRPSRDAPLVVGDVLKVRIEATVPYVGRNVDIVKEAPLANQAADAAAKGSASGPVNIDGEGGFADAVMQHRTATEQQPDSKDASQGDCAADDEWD